MRHHGTDPSTSCTTPTSSPTCPHGRLRQRAASHAARLPGRKIVFSNGPRHYAEAVLEIMGIRRFFVDVYAVEQMRFNPKPGLKGFHHLLKDHRLQASRCILVEDSAENLRTAKRLGMTTVWISRSLRQPAYVDVRLPSVLGLARHPVRRGASG
jgi:putative hydrolase of the HAD superfamily